MFSFLKKLGTILANAAGIFVGIGPLIRPFVGSSVSEYLGPVANDLTSIGQVIVQAEALIQAPGSGAQKFAASVPLIVQILKTSQMVSGKKIADEALFEKAAQEITQGVVDLLQSISPDEVNGSHR